MLVLYQVYYLDYAPEYLEESAGLKTVLGYDLNCDIYLVRIMFACVMSCLAQELCLFALILICLTI